MSTTPTPIPAPTVIDMTAEDYRALVKAYARAVVTGSSTVSFGGNVLHVIEAEDIIEDMHDILDSNAAQEHNLLKAAGFH